MSAFPVIVLIVWTLLVHSVHSTIPVIKVCLQLCNHMIGYFTSWKKNYCNCFIRIKGHLHAGKGVMFNFPTQSCPLCPVSHETCLLDQVLELIMSEKPPPSSISLFLNEDADKAAAPEPPSDLKRRICAAMERKASIMKEKISSVSKEGIKDFFKRNLFVLFTIAAVVLGKCACLILS